MHRRLQGALGLDGLTLRKDGVSWNSVSQHGPLIVTHDERCGVHNREYAQRRLRREKWDENFHEALEASR